MADIGNQVSDFGSSVEGLSLGLERVLGGLDRMSGSLANQAAVDKKIVKQNKKFQKAQKTMKKVMDKAEKEHATNLANLNKQSKAQIKSIASEIKLKQKELKQLGISTKSSKTFGESLKGVTKGLAGFAKGIKAGLSAAVGGGGAGIMAGLEKIPYLGGIIATMVAGGKTMVDLLTSHMKFMADITRQTGLTGDAAAKHREEIIATNKEIDKYGYNLKETLQLTQDLREAFGDVSYVTKDLVQMSAELQVAYRMGVSEANELIEATERAGIGARNFEETMHRTAIVMGADVGMVMRDVAKNVQMIEIYAGRGEKYFARMATRATMLGTSMETLEKSGEIFSDFERASEALGSMGQVFGPEFHDGLKSMHDLRLMYERGDMLGIQEHISEQAAQTLYYEEGILKSRQTGEKLWMSQIKKHSEVMQVDEVTARRMLESSAMLNEMKRKGFEMSSEQKEVYASELDYVMAMRSAQREMTDAEGKRLTDRDILQKLETRGWKELVKESQKAIDERVAVAEAAEDLPLRTLESMDELTKSMNAISGNIERTGENAGKELNEVVITAVKN